MKLIANTLVAIRIQKGRTYFPLAQKLIGRRVQSINVVSGLTPFETDAQGTVIDNDDITLSLTSNGTDYIFQDISLRRFRSDVCKGINISVSSVLSIQDCYITCTDDEQVGTILPLVVWYEVEGYKGVTSKRNLFNSFDVKIDPSQYRNYLPDNRTLAGRSFTRIFAAFPDVTPNYAPGVNKADIMKAGYITLVKGSFAVWDRMPVAMLDQLDWYIYQELDNIVFDFDSSFVEVAQNDISLGYLQLCVKYN